MTVVTSAMDLRRALDSAPAEVCFVPTMGALHEGHASLIRRAREVAETVVVSVFVNPTQFGRGEDFERYPRDPEGDALRAYDAGASVVFVPPAADVYPEGFATSIDPGVLAGDLCGRTRPGHFAGVATVVVRLFGLVRPSSAIFGRKDYQQLAIVRSVTRDLALGIEIIGAPTVRDADGMALSSRNHYLQPEERRRARAIPRALRAAAERFAQRPIVDAELLTAARDELNGLDLEYLELRRADDLTRPEPDAPAVLLVAARVGATRLIDNVILDPRVPDAARTELPEVPR
jgi:pantoate--beta-alanine ligase